MSPITLKEAIALLESGQWLQSLRFITADVTKNTGGQVIELGKCRMGTAKNKTWDRKELAKETNTTRFRKDPNHSLHFTRNIELQNRQIKKSHPIIITHINNHPIL